MFLFCLAGYVLFKISPYHNALNISYAIVIAAGALVLFGCWLIFGDSTERRNGFRILLAGAGAAAIIISIVALILILSGAEDVPRLGAGTAKALAGLAAGALGVYYGVRYQQDMNAVELAEEIGFSKADSGLFRPDSFYDGKGTRNNIETLFNINQHGGSRYSGPCYSLEILCRVANPEGINLIAYPRRGRPIKFFLPPEVKGLPGWDWCTVRSSPAEPAAERLGRSFADFYRGTGDFDYLFLKGGKFKFVFSHDGWAGKKFVETVINMSTILASRFN